MGLPHLDPWKLSIFTYQPVVRASKSKGMFRSSVGGAVMAPPPQAFRAKQRSVSDDDMGFGLFDGPDADMEHRGLEVSSKGNVSTTFRVPGLISIPSDGEAHAVTIIQLRLDASLSWVSVPQQETRTHLKVVTIITIVS